MVRVRHSYIQPIIKFFHLPDQLIHGSFQWFQRICHLPKYHAFHTETRIISLKASTAAASILDLQPIDLSVY